MVLEPLKTLLKTYPNDNVVFVGDFNTKSTIWGQRPTDPRGLSLILFFSNMNLEIINDPDGHPRFLDHQEKGWINVLLVCFCARHISDWRICDVET